MSGFATIPEALDAVRAGLPVLVLDDEGRENEGDAIIAAEAVSAQWMGWMIRHSSGYLCAPMPAAWADRLQLPPMVVNNQDPRQTNYTVSVDAAAGITTGISASDRARTARLLADPTTCAEDLHRPGHVLPLRARDGGVLERAGHTEAAVDLCRLAGLSPVGVIGELVHDDGEMMRCDDVLALGAEHGLPVITIEALAEYRHVRDRVERVGEAALPTEHGDFICHAYRDLVTGAEHVALVSTRGIRGDDGHSLVRVHSECVTGEAFGSRRCDCGPQLHAAMAEVATHGGVVVYLRGHEGRGVGLANKICAYAQQDSGLDTVDAQTALGLPVDAREYGAAVAILADLSVHDPVLLSNNPEKHAALRALGEVTLREHTPGWHAENAAYLQTKRERMGHQMPSAATLTKEGTR